MLKNCTSDVNLASLSMSWGNLGHKDNLLLVTDDEMYSLAVQLGEANRPHVHCVQLVNLSQLARELGVSMAHHDAVLPTVQDAMARLTASDILVVIICIDTFIQQRYNRIFAAFRKPTGLEAKYAFVRPVVTPEAFAEAISTKPSAVDAIVAQYESIPPASHVRIQAPGGTDITFQVRAPHVISYRVTESVSAIYLPPAELYFGIVEGSAEGVIVADVTVGELRVYADLLDPLGIVDEPVFLAVQAGKIVAIEGGEIATRLDKHLASLDDSCRLVIELGIGLSSVQPTGIIGIDESIAGTCHFGIGNSLGYGGTNDAPIHLDVVVDAFSLSVLDPSRRDCATRLASLSGKE